MNFSSFSHSFTLTLSLSLFPQRDYLQMFILKALYFQQNAKCFQLMSFHVVHLQMRFLLIEYRREVRNNKKELKLQNWAWTYHSMWIGIQLFLVLLYSTGRGSEIKMKLIEAISHQLCVIYVLLMLMLNCCYVYMRFIVTCYRSLLSTLTSAHTHTHISVREFYFITWTSIILLNDVWTIILDKLDRREMVVTSQNVRDHAQYCHYDLTVFFARARSISLSLSLHTTLNICTCIVWNI